MKLKMILALRLVRKDIDRLTDIHRRQFFMAVDPIRARAGGDIEDAIEQIETGKKMQEEEEGDVVGLAYVCLENTEEPSEAYEGWFTDARHYPDTESMPDGGAFFKAGTTKLAGVGMSQHTYSLDNKTTDSEKLFEALKEMGSTFTVTVKGAALKMNPPFAFATAPKKESVKKEPIKPVDLEVVEARRYTGPETRALSPQVRLQLNWGIDWKFTTHITLESMQKPMIGDKIYWSVDLGPHPEAIKLINGRPGTNEGRNGLVHLKLRTREQPERVFEGWFYDKKLFPSKDTKLFWGCLMQAGTATPIGVTLENGKVKAYPKKGLADAEGIAEGFKKLGVTFEVQLQNA